MEVVILEIDLMKLKNQDLKNQMAIIPSAPATTPAKRTDWLD